MIEMDEKTVNTYLESEVDKLNKDLSSFKDYISDKKKELDKCSEDNIKDIFYSKVDEAHNKFEDFWNKKYTRPDLKYDFKLECVIREFSDFMKSII